MFDQDSISIRTWIFILIGFICYIFLTLFLVMNSPRERTYNCSIAEISPDYTASMKEQCRKLRAQSGRF